MIQVTQGTETTGGSVSRQSRAGWHFFIDRGGTFTDIVALAPDGRLSTLKLLSENPEHYDDAALAGIDRLLASCVGTDSSVAGVRLGTTIGTNALLERRGAETVLVTTRGFGDVLRIGTQQRPDIFALDIELGEMLYSDVIEAGERVDAIGNAIAPLDRDMLRKDLMRSRANGIRSVAIAFVNAYRNPLHELQAAAIAKETGFENVSISTEINPSIKITERGTTTVVDAYLTPVLDAYKAKLDAGLRKNGLSAPLWFMQSHGGLIDAQSFRACDSVLSGPAGGVVGMATTAREAGFDAVIGFDMGGTSTDVSVYAGSYERTKVSELAGTTISRPMLDINTVAAGGGSLLWYDGGRLHVGPESAGADPGPTCYRRGGPLALTDANVLLGRIQADFFPRVFGPDAEQPIDTEAVEAAFAAMAREVAAASGSDMDAVTLAEGFIEIAVANMAAAIEQISIQRGYDIGDFALACFGGAGGQHACAVADALGIETILVHPLSGVLSAYGIGLAERRLIESSGIHARLDTDSLGQAREQLDKSGEALRREFDVGVTLEARVYLRMTGSDTLLAIGFDHRTGIGTLEREFASQHRQRFGFEPDQPALFLHSLEVEAIAANPLPPPPLELDPNPDARAVDRRSVCIDGEWSAAPVYRRSSLGVGTQIAGPAMIFEDNATIVVEPQWNASVKSDAMLVLQREKPVSARAEVSTEANPIRLEIFNNRFMHIAEQMGAVLEQTAYSVNIKERLDYSCALFDSGGELIANAPHVPVHLGSMGESVREVIRSATSLEAGDAYMLNAPYRGGTHLPDITVVSPIFFDGSHRPDFFVASRAHHADVGGSTPGSMPALSRTIEQEGIVIDPTRIVRGGNLNTDAIVELLSKGSYPARNPDQNVADIRAQLAANAKGLSELERLVARYRSDVVHAYMRHVRENAEACAREALRGLAGGQFTACLDSGERIEVSIAVDRERGEAVIDFTGTSGVSANNLNAPRSVVQAVVLYVLRTLIEQNIPLNAGCLEPVDLVIPEHSLLDPAWPAAVAGGNVETSQCIADVLLAAFGAAAASQGTMNNLSFGNERHQYYETICGGTGAGPGFNGASAVHSHMTNSRLTDIEVLEQRYPVRVARFAIRSGSGGAGRWHGGDGVIREIEFLEPMHVSLLANRRVRAPYGLDGGRDGQAGRDSVIRRDGSVERIAHAVELDVEAGERIRIETPGGGGYGKSKKGVRPHSG